MDTVSDACSLADLHAAADNLPEEDEQAIRAILERMGPGGRRAARGPMDYEIWCNDGNGIQWVMTDFAPFATLIVEGLTKYVPMLNLVAAAAEGDAESHQILQGAGTRLGLEMLLACRGILDAKEDWSRHGLDDPRAAARFGQELGVSYAVLLTAQTPEQYTYVPVMGMEELQASLDAWAATAWLERHSGYELSYQG